MSCEVFEELVLGAEHGCVAFACSAAVLCAEDAGKWSGSADVCRHVRLVEEALSIDDALSDEVCVGWKDIR